MIKSGYASTDTRPRIWAVLDSETREVLATNENLDALHEVYEKHAGHVVYTKIPKED